MDDSPLLSFEFNRSWSSRHSKSPDIELLKYLHCDETSSPFITSQDEEEKLRTIKRDKDSNYGRLKQSIVAPPHSRSSSNNSQWVPSEDESPPPTKVLSVRTPPSSMSLLSSPLIEDEELEEEDEDEDDDEEDFTEEDKQLLMDEEASEEGSDEEDDDGISLGMNSFDEQKGDFLDDEVIVYEDNLFEDRIPKPMSLQPHIFQESNRELPPRHNSNNQHGHMKHGPLCSPNMTGSNKVGNTEIIPDLERLMNLWKKKNLHTYENIYLHKGNYIGVKRMRLFDYISRLHYELALRMGLRYGNVNYRQYQTMDKGNLYREYGVERTLFLCFHLMDLFFATPHELGDVYNNLICLTILFISGKFEDVNIDVNVFHQMLQHEGYSIKLLRDMEFAMLFSLNKFDLVHATIYDFMKLRIQDWKNSMLRNKLQQLRSQMRIKYQQPQNIFRSPPEKRKIPYAYHPCRVMEPPAFFHPMINQQIQLQQQQQHGVTSSLPNTPQQQREKEMEQQEQQIRKKIEGLEKRLENICVYILNTVVMDLLYIAFDPKLLVDMVFDISTHILRNNQLHPVMTMPNNNNNDNDIIQNLFVGPNSKEKSYKWVLMLLKKENSRKSFLSRKYKSNEYDSVSKKMASLLC